MRTDRDVEADDGGDCCCLMFVSLSLEYNPMWLIFIPLQAMAMAFPLLTRQTGC